MNAHRWAVWTVWGAALVGVVAVLATVPSAVLAGALMLVLAACMLLAFVLQLGVADRVGLVARLSAASVGAFVVVLIGALVALLR